MKIFLIVLIVLLFGLLGYSYKLKLKNQIKFLNELNSFNAYYISSVTIFKNNIQDIISEYQNSKQSNIFIEKNGIYLPNAIEFKNNIKDNQKMQFLLNYYENIGKNNRIDEKNIQNEVSTYIKVVEQNTSKKLDNEGSLYFKTMIAIGLIIAIIIW